MVTDLVDEQLTVVALEPQGPLRAAHSRTRRILGSLAASALLASAVALPIALRSHSHDAPPAGAAHASGPRYTSTAVVRVAPKADAAVVSSTRPPGIMLAKALDLARAPKTRNSALAKSHRRAGDPTIGFSATRNPAGDLVSLTVTAPDGALAALVSRNWATALIEARDADAKERIQTNYRDITTTVEQLHNDLRRVDARLKALLPAVYGNIDLYDAPNGNVNPRKAPPPVPPRGSVKALNLAFERIRILSRLNDAGNRVPRGVAATSLVFTHFVSQTPPRLIKPPHHGTTTSTVLIAIGTVVAALTLLGAAFMLGRRSRRPRPS